jgi:hypothetical protein
MSEQTAHFFVDEAGDLSLFGRRGKSLAGTEGVSKCFMVGVAQVIDPAALQDDLAALHRELLKDEYLKHVYSMCPQAGKTAKFFHAKDDCPEVRREVYKLLARHDIKVQVAIRRKWRLIEQSRGNSKPTNPNLIYDDLVKSLFKRCLHKADQNVITFARRGKSDREEALRQAIRRAQDNFERDMGIVCRRLTKVIPSVPSESHGLQAVDYFLWAVQRLYEKADDRYFSFLAPQFRLIMDFDDVRTGRSYGRWYSDSDPLTKEKIMPVEG